MRAIVVLLALSACSWINEEKFNARLDQDQDGLSWLEDCDDSNPNLSELQRFYFDDDGDGFGDSQNPEERCLLNAPQGMVSVGGDCNDGDPAIHPDANEVCNSIDDNCDGLIDDADPLLDGSTADVWLPDADDDGYPDGQSLEQTVRACVQPKNFTNAEADADCDDNNPAISPAQIEQCGDGKDNDCDGLIDDQGPQQTEWYPDADGDEWPDRYEVITACGDPLNILMEITETTPNSTQPRDCNPSEPTVYPGADDEWYDGVDSDCVGNDDYDQDGDGVRDPSGGGNDCDDTNSTIYPGADDIWYDGIDSDCRGNNDLDRDGDGVAALEAGGGDCDDDNPAINPLAPEFWYDGVDSNCDGADDFDQDGDGVRAPSGGGDDCDDQNPLINPLMTETWYDGLDADCAQDNDFDQDGDGAVALEYGGTDCDDTNAAILPGAADIWYDGIDSDCEGNNDLDQDGDGYASENAGGDDCDDENSAIHPGATEFWYDGADSNCDGSDDFDQDGDGYQAISGGGTDCDDLNDQIHPGMPEIWYDGVDSNCNGDNDFDQDADGVSSIDFGGTDCDDTDSSVLPGADEVWYDGVDSDCDQANDYDQDGDGVVADSEGGQDCDDLNPNTYPGATDIWYDGVDSDCAGDDDYDQDGDGQQQLDYGGMDCDDTDASVYVGATDLWYDGVDSDCDGANDNDQDGDGELAASVGGTDCDDTNSNINTTAVDIWYDGIDSDCRGNNDYDQDRDGVMAFAGGGDDCDDTDSSIYPGAPDLWYDGIDSNCDGADDFDQDGDGQITASVGGRDCDDADPEVFLGAPDSWYDGVDSDCAENNDFDQDGDGATSLAFGGTDCDDEDPDVFVGAVDAWYDGVDSDCSGNNDYDQDGDGVLSNFGGGDDCDDTDSSIYPGAPDAWYDGIDHDCAGNNDFDQDGDGVMAVGHGGDDCDDLNSAIRPGLPDAWYDGVDSDCWGNDDYDQDEDGYRDPSGGGSDCDDNNEFVHPGAEEIYYDGVDQDCAGDDDYDQDGDGRTALLSLTGTHDDCDDEANTTFPGATEIADDGIDQDCNGVDAISCFADSDGDGFGGLSLVSLDGACVDGLTAVSGDCDDSDVNTYPGATELCDLEDQDCNGFAEGGVLSVLYRDGTRAALDPLSTVDSVDALRIDACGGTWDLQMLWDPQFGDLELVANDNFARPTLTGTRPLLVGGGEGLSTLRIRGFNVQYSTPGTTLMSMFGVADFSFQRPTILLEDLSFTNTDADGLLNIDTTDLVISDTTVTGGTFAHSVFVTTESEVFSFNSAFEQLSHTGQGVFEARDSDVDMLFTDFRDNTGRAVYLRNTTLNTTETVWSNIVQPNGAHGGALYLLDSTFNDVNGVFSNNSTNGDGGAISSTGASFVNLQGTQFNSNGSYLGHNVGAGGAISSSGTVTADDVQFNENNARSKGGAVSHQGPSLTANKVVFNNNNITSNGSNGRALWASDGEVTLSSVTYDGGAGPNTSACIAMQSTASVEIIGLSLKNCDTRCIDIDGGAQLFVDGTTFERCGTEADLLGGGAIRANDVLDITLSGNQFIDNHSKGDGGAVFANGNSLWLDNNSWSKNHADGEGGALYAPNADSRICDQFTTNNATLGGGAAVLGGDSTIGFDRKGDCDNELVFESNATEGAGGAIIYSNADSTQRLEIHGTTFRDNSSNTDGGALLIEGVVDCRESKFFDNNAFNGGAAHITAGLESFHFGSTGFINNSAKEKGGGLYVTGSGWPKSYKLPNFKATTFDESSATTGTDIYVDIMTGTTTGPDGPEPTGDFLTGDIFLGKPSSYPFDARIYRGGIQSQWYLFMDSAEPWELWDSTLQTCTYSSGPFDLNCDLNHYCDCP